MALERGEAGAGPEPEPEQGLAASMAAAGRVLVYGGRGALGSQCVQYFKARNWVSAGRAAAGPGAGGRDGAASEGGS